MGSGFVDMVLSLSGFVAGPNNDDGGLHDWHFAPSGNAVVEAYALKAGQGWIYRYGIAMAVKLGEQHAGRGAAVTEHTTRKGEEPPDQTHPSEDEVFSVLSGEITIRCGGQSFEVQTAGRCA